MIDKDKELPQVLHRLQYKEKLMQKNFDAPVWLLKLVFECRIAELVWSGTHLSGNHLRKPKFARNRAILSAHFSGVKFYNGFFIGFFLVLHWLLSVVRCSWRSSVLRGFRYPPPQPQISPPEPQNPSADRISPTSASIGFRWSKDTSCAMQRLHWTQIIWIYSDIWIFSFQCQTLSDIFEFFVCRSIW